MLSASSNADFSARRVALSPVWEGITDQRLGDAEGGVSGRVDRMVTDRLKRRPKRAARSVTSLGTRGTGVEEVT
jgi:hypothetical protein